MAPEQYLIITGSTIFLVLASGFLLWQGRELLELVSQSFPERSGAMPVLLYPVSVQSAQDEGDVAVIRFVGHVRLNPAFVTVMREQQIAAP